ncbi:GAF domain/histidine kinase-, DNA gyrase B-, and HSP90-like ATPase [Methyloglobulus morosus KoM1]|uniref:GAF domain/histidine kinase-, DNA gyrase B-, and HSP90-like ATPase n=1 Tax=Methyloglobulus morosus KoM1 TaxID=1116472 RepID=V5BZM0_9GAMM|nr:GAF domain-containing sensor histidine kinase [Methyloglobulus morosus]ESS71677.1 GAF domain/histidine kinase-, DNA gyrase B-, and HSP90-like ATPase [Methyloglobulus morosus KoM1]
MQKDNLLSKLFKASHGDHSSIITNLLKAVDEVFPSIMCTFWRINHKSNTFSTYAREGYSPSADNNIEYVHKIKGSLNGYVLDEVIKNNINFKRIEDVKKSPYCDLHRNLSRAKSLNLSTLYSIPIRSYDLFSKIDNYEKYCGIVNIYPQKNIEIEEDNIEFIKDYFSLMLSRKKLLARESIAREIIAIYEKKYKKDLSSILHSIINKIIRDYVPCEGCSVFIWDQFNNRLNLAQTTGLETNLKKSDIHYYLGEGLTGMIAQGLEPIIIEDISHIDESNFKTSYEHKYYEKTEHKSKSFMGIPILSPSRPSEVLGIIRLINRLNPLAKAIDYFNQDDLDLIKHATILIALYMEYDQSEIFRTAFAARMAHEIQMPASSIQRDADSIIKNLLPNIDQNNFPPRFPKPRLKDYLESMKDHAGLQLALSNTVVYSWKFNSGQPRSERYKIANCDLLKDVLLPAKKLAIPLARTEQILFDNIQIIGHFPDIYADKYAFEQVFFNLISNSIKYRNKQINESFTVIIKGYILGDYEINNNTDNNLSISRGYIITISDYGIGIKESDKRKIFLLGYRGKEIEKYDVKGLGIGLNVVLKILTDFNCKIWVSHVNSPTEFKIFIPEELTQDIYTKDEKWNLF